MSIFTRNDSEFGLKFSSLFSRKLRPCINQINTSNNTTLQGILLQFLKRFSVISSSYNDSINLPNRPYPSQFLKKRLNLEPRAIHIVHIVYPLKYGANRWTNFIVSPLACYQSTSQQILANLILFLISANNQT